MKLMQKLVFVSLLLSCTTLFSQELGKQLRKQVENCTKNFEDVDGDSVLDATIDVDSVNGYMHVSGTWPTCGCGCKATVGAYKQSKGNYVFLIDESWNCNWKSGVSSDKPMNTILPPGFGLHLFTENYKYTKGDESGYFYLSAEIPRTGTETKFNINIIPFGMKQTCTKGICYLVEEGNPAEYISLYDIKFFAQEMEETDALDHILKGEYNRLSSRDYELFQSYTGKDNAMKNADIFRHHLNYIYEAYLLYSKLGCTTLIMDFDKYSGRFYLKDKTGKPEQMDFKTFVLTQRFYSPAC